MLGTTCATSGVPGFQTEPPGNLTAAEASVWFRRARCQWRPYKNCVHQMKNMSCGAPHRAPFAVSRLCSEPSELFQHATFQTLVFLFILKATLSITCAESVSAGNNPILFVFFVAFCCYLLLA